MANSVGLGRQLFISSTQGRYATDNKLNSDLVFDIRDPITSNWDSSGHSRRVRVALVNAVVPMSFYTVNTRNNKVQLYFPLGDITFEYEITPRTYTGTTLAAELTSIMADGPDLVWEYVESDLKLRVTNGAPTANDYELKLDGSTAASVIGLQEDTYLAFQSTTFLQNPIDLGGPRYLVFDTDLPVETSDSSEATRGMLGVIPVNAPPGALLYYSPTPPQYLETTIDQLNRLRISITDEDHNIIDFQNVRWSAQLAFV